MTRALQLLPAFAALLTGLASAEAWARPTDGGGLWSYSDEDLLAFHDSPDERVRVHYSRAGPNATLLADDDADDVPDFVEQVAETAVAALELYAELGFRPPVAEATFGLEALGGSPAFDIYLLDFQGSADGVFSLDACADAPRHCAGWFALENDFAGYSYPSLDYAVDTVVPHELFHAVQAAYDGAQPVWFSEGTAVWAQRVYLPESADFIGKCDAYLALADRPIDAPPAGPVQSFSYGTALFWWFLHERHDGALDVALQLASESPDGEDVDVLAGVAAALEDAGDSLDEAWTEFARRNLATGGRDGLTDSYEFAAQLAGVTAEEAGATIDDAARFQPTAASYYRLDHGGGPLAAGVDTADDRLRFSLHPVVDGQGDGPVEPAVLEWRADVTGLVSLGDYPPGGYWVVGTLPVIAEASAKTRLCLGSEAFVDECFPPEDTTTVGGDDDDDDDDTEDPMSDSDTDAPDSDTSAGVGEGRDGQGCACASGQGTSPPLAAYAGLLLLALLLERRRPGRDPGAADHARQPLQVEHQQADR